MRNIHLTTWKMTKSLKNVKMYPWRGDYGRGGGRGDQAFHNENEPPSFYGGGGVQKPGDPAINFSI